MIFFYFIMEIKPRIEENEDKVLSFKEIAQEGLFGFLGDIYVADKNKYATRNVRLLATDERIPELKPIMIKPSRKPRMGLTLKNIGEYRRLVLAGKIGDIIKENGKRKKRSPKKVEKS